MTEVLILSYHYPPFEVIASYRAKAYTDYFYKHGIYPTVVTHFWDNENHEKVEVRKFDTHTEIRLPLTKTTNGNKWRRLEGNKWMNKISILLSWFQGHLDTTAYNRDSYLIYSEFLQQHLKEKEYDFMIGIFSPHHHLKLCYELHNKFGISYALDFRDLWNNGVLQSQYSPSILERLENECTEYYWEKWLSKAVFFTITNKWWQQKVNSFSKTKGYVVTNGYENGFDLKSSYSLSNKHFVLGVMGRFYSMQNIDIFFHGLKVFLEEEKPQQFKLSLLGIHKESEEFLKKLETIPSSYLNRLIKTDKKGAVDFVRSVNLLWHPAFDQLPGWCSAKIYDYMAFGNEIVICPGDNGIVDEIITKTNTGIIVNSSEEVTNILKIMYHQWRDTGPAIKTNYYINEIENYSRENQVKKVAKIILSEIES